MDFLFILFKKHAHHFIVCRTAWIHPKKVMVHGVVRETGRGVPECVKQKEVTKKKEIAKQRWTLKAACLEGDPQIPGLVCTSLYDSKPFYMMTNACEELKWVKKTREVYHKGLNRMVKLPFYRLNVVDEYNNNMNNVDVADQVRGSYRCDKWMRKRKWWWSMFWWCFEMSLTNAYILYNKYMKMHEIKPMSHYEFQKRVALAWINQAQCWPLVRRNVCVNNLSLAYHMKSTTPSVSMTEISVSSLGSSGSSTVMPTVIHCNKATAFNENSLDPKKGKLRLRLDSSQSHWPLENRKAEANCQLHKWVTGKKKRIFGALFGL